MDEVPDEVVLTLEEEDRLASLLTEVVRPGRAAKPKPAKPARPKSMRKLVGVQQPIGSGVVEVERMGEAVRLRTAGLGYAEIAAEMDVSHDTARRLVDKWLRLQAPTEEQTAELRQVMLNRLEQLHETYWAAARGEGTVTYEYRNSKGQERTKTRERYPNGPNERYGELVLKIMDRQAKLMGVDLQPSVQQVTITAESVALFLGWDPQNDSVAGAIDVSAREITDGGQA